jgi:hypothetical protein
MISSLTFFLEENMIQIAVLINLSIFLGLIISIYTIATQEKVYLVISATCIFGIAIALIVTESPKYNNEPWGTLIVFLFCSFVSWSIANVAIDNLKAYINKSRS